MSAFAFALVCVQALLIQNAFGNPLLGGLGSGSGNHGSYGGQGCGNIGVHGGLGVQGCTSVCGSVPVCGAVEYGGTVPAGGCVTIAGQCCGCGGSGGLGRGLH